MSSKSKKKVKSGPMDQFLFKRKPPISESNFEKGGTSKRIRSNQEQNSSQANDLREENDVSSEKNGDPLSSVDVSSVPVDPGERKMIINYHPDQRDDIRRRYILRGPVQPKKHCYPTKNIGGKARKFIPLWFDERIWLEYSIKKDAAFCLYCYLFPGKGKCTFRDEGWSCWNRKDILDAHSRTNCHYQAFKSYENLTRQDKSIIALLEKQSDLSKKEQKIRLTTTVVSSRYLLHQGLAFRGHDESNKSENRGNFLELVKFAASLNEDIAKVVLDKAPGNLQMTSPKIQKDVVNCAACETRCSIIDELGDDFFGILVDESGDVSHKEQRAVILRFVDKLGVVKERFFGIVHVKNTRALTLKEAIQELFSEHGLSFSNVRAQGYDGASNISGEFNGLKALIQKEHPYAFFVHCFAHQLQLTLVVVAKKHPIVSGLFDCINSILNVAGASCKRHDIIREQEATRIAEGLVNGDIESGTGLNQELSLKKPGDTRWGSYYRSLINVVALFTSVINVIENVGMDGSDSLQVIHAQRVQDLIRTFDFSFCVHIIIDVLGITNDLSLALQRKDQDIANAVKLVEVCKTRIQHMRDFGFEVLLSKVRVFCDKHDIYMPAMEDVFVIPGRTKRNAPQEPNAIHYKRDVFCSIIDKQLSELNDRFGEINSKLLIYIGCLSPINKFCNFDKDKLIDMAKMYPEDFSEVDVFALESQLENYIFDVTTDDRFDKVKGIADLSKLMVETRKHEVYILVYRLLKLALVLPVATASVERALSGMNIIKTRLRNRISDQFLKDCLLCYIEKDIFAKISNDAIIDRFQKLRTHRLPKFV